MSVVSSLSSETLVASVLLLLARRSAAPSDKAPLRSGICRGRHHDTLKIGKSRFMRLSLSKHSISAGIVVIIFFGGNFFKVGLQL